MQPADAARFAALVRASFTGLGVDPAPSAMRVTTDDVLAHLSRDGGVIIDPVCAGLLWDEREGGLYISRVAVDPGHRRRGLAGLLLAAAEAEATRRALPRIWLSTRLVLASNRRLFAAHGFAETAQHSHAGYSAPTYVDMEKRLGGIAFADEPNTSRRVYTGS
jgi:ribosomal protein S18 acetylase RimI-like enzyme